MNKNHQRTIIFFGVIGAGKGTQVDLLMNYFASRNEEVMYVYPGKEFRNLAQQDSFTARQIDHTLKQGKLIPDFFTNALATGMVRDIFTGTQHIIFDGYPRSCEQSRVVGEMIPFFNMPDPVVILLTLPEEEVMNRLMKRGRSDDTVEGIRTRLQVYHDEVVPALQELQKTLTLTIHTIDGNQSIEKVHQDIMQALALQE